jgi:hypothetical protein
LKLTELSPAVVEAFSSEEIGVGHAPYFIKTGPSGNRVSHVVLVRTAGELRTVMPFLREAFELAASEKS